MVDVEGTGTEVERYVRYTIYNADETCSTGEDRTGQSVE